MFSAKSGEDVYIAGRIEDPKSRKYECPVCDEPVSHVSATTRSLSVRVSEHFRHKKGADVSHPHKRFTWQIGNIMQSLLDTFDYPIFNVETDKRFQGSVGRTNLDFIVDLLVEDDEKKTVFIIESGAFNANNLYDQMNYLTSQDIASMVVLSAQGEENPRGKYFRSEFREHSGQTVKKVAGNEGAIYSLMGRNIYFDHDSQEIIRVKFDPYVEFHELDRETPSGFVIPAGEQRFETKKIHLVEGRFDDFGVSHSRRNNILVARPRHPGIDHYLEIEARLQSSGSDEESLYSIGERIGILLEGADETLLDQLSRRYGKDRLGEFFVE